MTPERHPDLDPEIVRRAFELVLLLARRERGGWPPRPGDEVRRFQIHTAIVELHGAVGPDHTGRDQPPTLVYKAPGARGSWFSPFSEDGEITDRPRYVSDADLF
jgi:hypothetical protein